MRVVLRCLPVLAVILLWAAGDTRAEDFFTKNDIDIQLFYNQRIHTFSNFFTPGENRFNEDRDLHVVYINPSIRLPIGDHAEAVFELEAEHIFDFHEQHGHTDCDIRNAYIRTLAPGCSWIWLAAGRQAISTVDGLIYDDESPAVRIYADFERRFDLPLKCEVIYTEVEQDSPYLHARLTYNFAFLESISLFYGWFRDTNSGVARIFNALDRTRDYRSRGDLYWTGFSLKTFFANIFIQATGIYEQGSIRLSYPSGRSKTVHVDAYLFDIQCDYSITEQLSVSLFFYLSSGDSRPRSGTLRSFIAIDPYVGKTNIFFNGGIDALYSSDNIGLTGIRVPGVMAPGLNLYYRPTERLTVKTTWAYLLPHRTTGNKGHIYGWEADCLLFYRISDSIQLFAEANVLVPGTYFSGITDNRDHVSTEVILGFTYFYNN